MKLGLHIADYAFAGGTSTLRADLASVAAAVEDAGFSALSVTDHLWQISTYGEESDPMLEAYTTLGFLAARTKTVQLLTLVTAATYRSPHLVAQLVQSLDSLSGGRAWLGIGTGWNEQEATGLDLDFPGLSDRFEALTDCIEVCRTLWSSAGGPPPRIMIGGAGERRTLRLVARYADACNVFGGPDAAHKLTVLRRHCAEVGRDFDSIEKTAIIPLRADSIGSIGSVRDQLKQLADVGYTTTYLVPSATLTARAIDALGSDVIPEALHW